MPARGRLPTPSFGMIDAARENAMAGASGDPVAFGVTIVFEERGAQTRVTMRSVFSSVAELERVKGFGAVEGGHQTLERLGEWLADRTTSAAP